MSHSLRFFQRFAQLLLFDITYDAQVLKIKIYKRLRLFLSPRELLDK